MSSPFQLRQNVLAHSRLLTVLDDFTTRRADFEPWFADLLDDARTVTAADLAAARTIETAHGPLRPPVTTG
ncbi:hypothetical protein [Streptomyces sp. NPDC005989]|uniref:hypothetical protein n=1 Tax=Streptomyces sp. NPDC005989 TaxID=3156727 RepID=UPI0033F12902